MTVAVVALFVGLGGSGYAAVTINGHQIDNRSIDGLKLKRHAVTDAELKSSIVGHSSARGVAAQAIQTAGFSFHTEGAKDWQEVLNFGGVFIQARCSRVSADRFDLDVRLGKIGGGGQLQSASIASKSAGARVSNEMALPLAAGATVNILPESDDNQVGHSEVASGGTAVSILWQADNRGETWSGISPGSGTTFRCVFAGTATRGG